jgi:hypothetical protein
MAQLQTQNTTLHTGATSIISSTVTKRRNKKHPANPSNFTYHRADVQELFPNMPKDHVSFNLQSWANCSLDITEPIALSALSGRPNPGYGVRGCYIIWQVPRAEIPMFNVMFQNVQIDQLLQAYVCYLGESSAKDPSDRMGGRVNSLKRDFEKQIANRNAPARSTSKEASAFVLAENMIANYKPYVESGKPFDTMLDCLLVSYIDEKTMLGPNGEQLTPKWVERTLIDVCRNNGKLVNQN